MNPMERKAIARIPATCPGPNSATSKSAQTRALIDREETIRRRANGRTAGNGAVFRAARSATGTAAITARSVPKVAMVIVSHKGRSRPAVEPQSGGVIRPNRSLACAGASPTNSQRVRPEMYLQEAARINRLASRRNHRNHRCRAVWRRQFIPTRPGDVRKPSPPRKRWR